MYGSHGLRCTYAYPGILIRTRLVILLWIQIHILDKLQTVATILGAWEPYGALKLRTNWKNCGSLELCDGTLSYDIDLLYQDHQVLKKSLPHGEQTFNHCLGSYPADVVQGERNL